MQAAAEKADKVVPWLSLDVPLLSEPSSRLETIVVFGNEFALIGHVEGWLKNIADYPLPVSGTRTQRKSRKRIGNRGNVNYEDCRRSR